MSEEAARMVSVLDRRLIDEPDTSIKLVFHKDTFAAMQPEWAERLEPADTEHRDYKGNLRAHGRVYEVWTAPGQEPGRVGFRRKLSDEVIL
jgi:hypothetical protein